MPPEINLKLKVSTIQLILGVGEIEFRISGDAKVKLLLTVPLNHDELAPKMKET